MSLNEVLWSKLDLSKFGSLDNVEVFDEPQIAEFENHYNPLHYGNGIFYRLAGTSDRMYIMHAGCKYPKACDTVWKIYVEYSGFINSVLGTKTIMRNVDPADCPIAYSKEIIDMYGGVDK